MYVPSSAIAFLHKRIIHKLAIFAFISAFFFSLLAYYKQLLTYSGEYCATI
jgi:hypothetical protein